MSVSEIQQVSTRLYSGYLDPRYPMGTWFGNFAVTGNATGGTLTIHHQFMAFDQPAVASILYSLEQLSILSTASGTQQYRVRTFNMDRHPAGALSNAFRVQSRADQSGGSSLDTSELLPVPLFLGAPAMQGTTASIALTTANVDVIVITMSVQGYFWGSRSILVDGGLQRPPFGLYRA